MDTAPGACVYVGLGTNLGTREAHLRFALQGLARLAIDARVDASPWYESTPMGPADQPDYLNAVARLRVRLSPFALLGELQALETERGRVRDGRRWHARVLDLDLLLYDRLRLDTDALRLPHPGIAERNFVLAPLADLDPDLHVPGLGRVTRRLDAIGRNGLCRLDSDHETPIHRD